MPVCHRLQNAFTCKLSINYQKSMDFATQYDFLMQTGGHFGMHK